MSSTAGTTLQNTKWQSCIDACMRCAEACEFCATSCLREQDIKMLDRWDQSEVDDTCLVKSINGDWLYAVGDINHRTLLIHIGKYQARPGDTL